MSDVQGGESPDLIQKVEEDVVTGFNEVKQAVEGFFTGAGQSAAGEPSGAPSLQTSLSTALPSADGSPTQPETSALSTSNTAQSTFADVGLADLLPHAVSYVEDAGRPLLTRWHAEMSKIGRGLSQETNALIEETRKYLGL